MVVCDQLFDHVGAFGNLIIDNCSLGKKLDWSQSKLLSTARFRGQRG